VPQFAEESALSDSGEAVVATRLKDPAPTPPSPAPEAVVSSPGAVSGPGRDDEPDLSVSEDDIDDLGAAVGAGDDELEGETQRAPDSDGSRGDEVARAADSPASDESPESASAIDVDVSLAGASSAGVSEPEGDDRESAPGGSAGVSQPGASGPGVSQPGMSGPGVSQPGASGPGLRTPPSSDHEMDVDIPPSSASDVMLAPVAAPSQPKVAAVAAVADRTPAPPVAAPARPDSWQEAAIEPVRPSLRAGDLAADDLLMARPRRGPTLLLGMILGSGLTLAAVYGPRLLEPPVEQAPAPASAPPSASIPPPPPEPVVEPEPEPEPSASPSASADKKTKGRPVPRRGPLPRPRKGPYDVVVPVPAPKGAPAPAPDTYE
jgi:hypothetical protein